MTYDRVLGEFATKASEARRRYRRFVEPGVVDPPPSPFARAVGGLVLGSGAFLSRIQAMLKGCPADSAVPQVRRLQARPSLEAIVHAVSRHFGLEGSPWQSGQRSDDRGRAVAAYVSRRRYGYPATTVAAALGYRGHSSVHYAIARIENRDHPLAELVAAIERELAY